MAGEHISLLHSIITPISRLTSSSSQSIGSGSTIYLDPTVLRISSRGGGSATNTDDNASGIACFAELTAKNGIFLEHKIESIAGNVIVFDVDLVQLRMALAATLSSMGSGGWSSEGKQPSAPLHNSGDVEDNNKNPASLRNSFGQYNNNKSSSFIVVMKLAKRSGLPCLCLDASCINGTLDVHHAVPVRILRAEEWP